MSGPDDVPEGRDPAAWHGAARIIAAVKAVDPAHRLDALALTVDAWAQTNGTLEVVA